MDADDLVRFVVFDDLNYAAGILENISIVNVPQLQSILSTNVVRICAFRLIYLNPRSYRNHYLNTNSNKW